MCPLEYLEMARRGSELLNPRPWDRVALEVQEITG